MKSNKVTNFSGKRFWLCGASTGMGFAVATELVARGATVVLMSRSQKNLDAAQKKLGKACVATVALDIADVKTAHKAALFAKKLGRFDGMLLNGGGPHGGKADDLKWADFEEAHKVLLSGPANLLLGLLPYLKNPASVVSIGSTTVKEPNPALPLSATYRLGLVAFLKNLANRVGPDGIRINTVAPGYTSTEKLGDLAAYVAAEQKKSEKEIYRLWGLQNPLQRIATPEEIAKVCAFLFSEDASYITGQTLLVDGGMMHGY